MGVTSGSSTIESANGVDSSKVPVDKTKNGHDKENNSSNGSVVKSECDGDSSNVITPIDTIEIGANINVSNNFMNRIPGRVLYSFNVLHYITKFLTQIRYVELMEHGTRRK